MSFLQVQMKKHNLVCQHLQLPDVQQRNPTSGHLFGG
jgi:hypothetical protein